VLKQSSRQNPDLLDERCRPLRNCARGICPCSSRAWRPPFAPLRTLTSASLRGENRIIPIPCDTGIDKALWLWLMEV